MGEAHPVQHTILRGGKAPSKAYTYWGEAPIVKIILEENNRLGSYFLEGNNVQLAVG